MYFLTLAIEVPFILCARFLSFPNLRNQGVGAEAGRTLGIAVVMNTLSWFSLVIVIEGLSRIERVLKSGLSSVGIFFMHSEWEVVQSLIGIVAAIGFVWILRAEARCFRKTELMLPISGELKS